MSSSHPSLVVSTISCIISKFMIFFLWWSNWTHKTRLLSWEARHSNGLHFPAGQHRSQSWLLAEAVFPTQLWPTSCACGLFNQQICVQQVALGNKKWFVGNGILKIKCEPSWEIQEVAGGGGLSREIEKIFFMKSEEQASCLTLGEKSGWCWSKRTRPLVLGLAPLSLMFISWCGEKKLWGSTHCFLLNNED